MKNKDISNRKILVVIMSFIMIFSLLLSYVYLIKEKDHECCCEECMICENISRCKTLIRNFGKMLITSAFLFICFDLMNYRIIRSYRPMSDVYLMRYRFRMNN